MNSCSPRIGVFLYSSDYVLSSKIRFEEVISYIKTLSDVICVESVDFCSAADMGLIKKAILAHDLNRIVIAPSIGKDDVIAQAATEAGIAPHLIEYANIREQAALIHNNIHDATEKSKLLISMAVAKMRVAKVTCASGAKVNQETCSGCGICIATCRYDAIKLIEDGKHRTAFVDGGVCEQCGACVAACPSGSLNMEDFSNEALISEIDECTAGLIDSKKPFPRILIFACNWCSYPAADAAGKEGLKIDPACCIIKTPCSARVDPEWIMRAFSRGADGVLVLGGKERHCHYRGGNVRTNNRIQLLSKVLESLGYDKRRIKADWVNPDEPKQFAAIVESFVNDVKEVGPNPERGIPQKERPTSASRD